MTGSFKRTLRQAYQQKRTRVPLEQQRECSESICTRIQSLEAYGAAKNIALYQAIHHEIDLTPLWQAASLQQKRCYFPKITAKRTLLFLPTTPETTWMKNCFGILEPEVNVNQALSPEQFDLMFIPLLAFDEQGTRLGMGAGYYDRSLAVCRPPLMMGVAYDFQKQSYIKPDIWDVPLTSIITPTTIYWINDDKLLANEI